MIIQQIINELELFAPLQYQEAYDNAGLIVGNHQKQCTGVLLSLDCTEAIIDEAIQQKCNLVISHHPLIFSGIKKINGSNFVEKTLIKAIVNNIAIYAAHTNIDNVIGGVNSKIALKVGLKNVSILDAQKGVLKKLVTFVPKTHHEKLMDALFEAGVGNIGNYSNCSFYLEGKGTFKGNINSQPFVGKAYIFSVEDEIRIEVVYPSVIQSKVISSLFQNHPYEEVSYDIYKLDNHNPLVGSGVIGELDEAMQESDFLNLLKKTFNLKFLKHSPLTDKPLKKVSLCGGSGKFLLKSAITAQADVYITSDLKYHDYFEAENKLLLVDIGHFESEQFTPEIFYDIIINKFPTFAVHLSKINTNPVNYF
jgi:dinuclear metal center YbgI/SA1388 family protein